MIKILFNEIPGMRIDYKSNPFLNIIKIIIFILIALLLSKRELYIATDDYNYLNYFLQVRVINADNYFVYLIEEPLWRFWTFVTTLIFSPENALRFTLFTSTVLFLFSVSRLNNKLFFLVAIVFVFHPDFATQMYFNQIRQGFALSLFLFIAIYFKRPVIGGILATLIHTSFIFPLAVIFLVLNVKSIKNIVLFSVIAVLFLYLSIEILANLDLGRRTMSYEFEGKFTINYYIYTIVLYIPALILITLFHNKEKHRFWFKVTLSAFFIFLSFTLFYYAAGRIMYYLSAFMLLMMLENYKSLGGKLALFYYLFFFVFQSLFLESTVLNKLSLILMSALE